MPTDSLTLVPPAIKGCGTASDCTQEAPGSPSEGIVVVGVLVAAVVFAAVVGDASNRYRR